jgi:hypothetical protein
MDPIVRAAGAVAGFLLLCLATPAAAQSDTPPERPPVITPAASATLPLPATCLLCEAAPLIPVDRLDARVDARALPKGVAPVIGGVVGAVVGFIAVRIACADRFCEMADLGGILGGAVVGVTIGKGIEGTLPPSPR